MRGALSHTQDLTRKLDALEKELKERLDVHEAAIVTILQRVRDIIDPPALPKPRRKQIAFQATHFLLGHAVARRQNAAAPAAVVSSRGREPPEQR